MRENRIDSLERRMRDLEAEIAELKGGEAPGVAAIEPPPVKPEPLPLRPGPVPAPQPIRTYSPAPTSAEPRPRLTLEDVMSPRNLAVSGAIAVFIGLAFLVSLGISNGWISETVRVIGGAAFSLLLVAGGIFSRERRRMGAPAEALVVAGAGGLFISLVAATRLYDLVDPVTALVLAALIGGMGVMLGLRWQSEAVATSIVSTALLSPLLLEVTYSVGLISFLVPVFAIAVAAAVHRPWTWTFTVTATLFLGSLIACVADAQGGSQIAAYGLALLTLVLCGAGSAGHLLRNGQAEEKLEPVVYGIFVSVASLLGMFLVSGPDSLDADWAAAWFSTSALLGAAVWWAAFQFGRKALAVTAFALASAATAAALGFLFQDGPMLTLAWSVEAACLITFGLSAWQRWVGIGVLGIAGLAALLQVPPDLLSEGSENLARDLAILAPIPVPLAAVMWRTEGSLQGWGGGLLTATAAYIGVLTVSDLIDPGSVVILVPLGLAAAVPLVVTRRDWTLVTFVIFGVSSVIFTLATAIPWDALVDGVPSAPEAAIAGAILVAVLAAAHLRAPENLRQPALWGALGLALYVASALVIDGFQGTAETAGGLPGRAQGQAIVSSLWALCGLGLIVAGLQRRHPNWRKAGLVLLVLSMLKITIYDLSSLSSAGRTISFILVGLALLAAAFAYQWMNHKDRTEGTVSG